MNNDAVKKDQHNTLWVFSSFCEPCLGDATFLFNGEECWDNIKTDPLLGRLTAGIARARGGRTVADIHLDRGANFLILVNPDSALLLVRAGVLHEKNLLGGTLVKRGERQFLLVEDKRLAKLGLLHDKILLQVVKGMREKFMILKLES